MTLPKKRSGIGTGKRGVQSGNASVYSFRSLESLIPADKGLKVEISRTMLPQAYRITAMTLLILLCLFTGVLSSAAQDTSRQAVPRGFKLAGVPNVFFNSDEGMGYGARLSLFNHAEGGYNPYYQSVDFNLLLTTRGRKQLFVFFDSPYMLGKKHRLTGEIRYQYYGKAPFYGIGNDTEYRTEFTLENEPDYLNTDYYGFERKRFSLWAMYQRAFGAFKLLGGAGIVHTHVAPLDGNTLMQQNAPLGQEGGWTNYVKVGLIYDTRDFEPAPGHGDWTDLILAVSNRVLGSDYNFTRLTFTNRHYFTLLPDVVFAERIVLEKAWGCIPFYEMAFFESSFRIQEGMGGFKTVRGLLKNRLIGPTKLFGNLELRWRFVDFSAVNQHFYLALGLFYDYGRVWTDNEKVGLRDFHTGQGAGLHIGWNETFIVSFDAARSKEVDFALYITIGYLF